MKLTILGNCGPYPGKGAGTSGYLLQSADTNVLLECGSGTVAQLWNHIEPKDLKAVILTHMHWDHVSDFMMLATTLQFAKMKGQLPENFCVYVYMQKEPAAMAELLENCPAKELFDFHYVKAWDNIIIDKLQILFTPARHPLPCVGMGVREYERFLYYTGDTNVMEELALYAKDADAILADCGLPNEAWNENAPHLSAGECGKLARDAGAKRLWLSHLPPYADEKELLAQAEEYFEFSMLTKVGDSYLI